MLSEIVEEMLMTFFHMMGQRRWRAVNIEKLEPLTVEIIAVFVFFSWCS